ncbi:hypothetical protein RHGRI_012324 [Rhododendron griersonianum]|uniref:Uncharacterized protein n=1 Tax=Rhododendron griersonianum TaxID=479676 RepID=A0AAV6KPZ1_9ERIC|nr:hypothetical protein RHGRI_012324 [Rhododendron griersonianum]
MLLERSLRAMFARLCMGGCDKQGFPMKQGVLTVGNVNGLGGFQANNFPYSWDSIRAFVDVEGAPERGGRCSEVREHVPLDFHKQSWTIGYVCCVVKKLKC